MLTREVVLKYKAKNFIRKADKNGQYWFDVSVKRLNELRQNGDFKFVIFSELETADYYIIPFDVIKHLFINENLVKDEKKRWIGSIRNHRFKITNSGLEIDVKTYYSTSINLLINEAIIKSISSDIESLNYENNTFIEGGDMRQRLISFYERDQKLRLRAIEIHGIICQICDFDFYKVYGQHGKDYIEVHHKKALHTLVEPSQIDPASDMAVVCSNCHRMIHRKKYEILTIDELKVIWQNNNTPSGLHHRF